MNLMRVIQKRRRRRILPKRTQEKESGLITQSRTTIQSETTALPRNTWNVGQQGARGHRYRNKKKEEEEGGIPKKEKEPTKNF